MKSLTILVLLCVYESQGFLFPTVKTVEKLDVNKYLGLWYEAYSSLIQRQTFQRNSLCTTATYSLQSDGNIKVYNAGNIKKPDGKLSAINGTAQLTSKTGELIVNFPGNAPTSTSANYLVIKLGPATYGKDGQYEYTVVSAPKKLLVWVLVRDVPEFKAKYEKEVLGFLKSNGFDWFYNKPRATFQGPKCIYPTM